MARIFPTSSIRYTRSAGDPSGLLAPPFDVIDDELARDLRARSPYNAVRLILPEGDPPDRYGLAAARLGEWLEAGVLARSEEETLYIYRQEFVRDGRPVVRLALLAAVELTEFGHGDVWPHETTHRGPKQDRLALMRACRTQLSPIYFIARDADGSIAGLLAEASGGSPLVEASTPDSVGHTLVTAPPELVREIARPSRPHELLIADGHHRYETALELARQLPASPAARQVLAAVVSEHDPGLVIRATHRRLARLPPDWEDLLAAAFEFDSGPGQPSALAKEVARRGGTAIGLFAPAAASDSEPALAERRPHSTASILRARPRALAQAGLAGPEAAVAAVIFDRLILRTLTGHGADAAAEAGWLSYHQDPAAAAGGAEGSTAGFVLPPIRMETLWQVVRGGARLPPKSTYFAPKIPSGLLFRPL